MNNSPSTNGRNTNGRFVKGNPGGPGNPNARRVAHFRQVLMEAVSDEDLHDLARTLIKKGKGGDVAAIREVLDRLMGRSEGMTGLLQMEKKQAEGRMIAMMCQATQQKRLEEQKNKTALVQQSGVGLLD